MNLLSEEFNVSTLVLIVGGFYFPSRFDCYV